MARRIALKGTSRKKKARASRVSRSKLTEPDLSNGLSMPIEKFYKAKHSAMDFYRMDYKSSHFKTWILDYCKEHKDYKKKSKAIAKNPEWRFNCTTGSLCRLLNRGMPDIHPDTQAYIDKKPGLMGKAKPATEWVHKQLDELFVDGEKVIEEKEKEKKVKEVGGPKPTIQERIQAQTYLQLDAIDTWLETWVDDPHKFNPKGFNFPKHFLDVKTTQAHARKMKDFYADEIAELNELLNPLSKKELAKLPEKEQDWHLQLIEAYACYDKKGLQRRFEGFQNFMGALEVVIDTAKANRKTRKRAPRSKEKIVSKLKYARQDNKFQLASINPIDIIGCEELWVFNVKTRKIGRYMASSLDPMHLEREGTGLSVKGTTITGFNAETSVQKTLRKPEEKLKEFKESGKIKLRTFLDNINAVDIKLNGRINTDTIILKAVR